jgi:hypothetical protein
MRASALLSGSWGTNATVTLTLKEGDLEDLDGISTRCVRVGVEFADGLSVALAGSIICAS